MDCVHFAHSHRSRMIQLADVYFFAATLRHSGPKGRWQKGSRPLLTLAISVHSGTKIGPRQRTTADVPPILMPSR